ncbi:hypothetical protein ACE7GA_05105 [Roseomonas sp. CCTCC AB2023176]|uniref:hypothetical protein n=1 Tax=Roseomonas sp. CCTCC AB2023176 TaxID=3342640 RepID=UPI0035DBB9F9
MSAHRRGLFMGLIAGAGLTAGAALAQRTFYPAPDGFHGLPAGRTIGLVCTDGAGQAVQGRVPVGTAATSQQFGFTALSVRCP